MHRTIAIGLAALCVGLVPTADAHDCEADRGCDEDACVEGEDHHHVNRNYVARDESCRSTGDGEPYEPCYVAGKQYPDAVCDTIFPFEVGSG